MGFNAETKIYKNLDENNTEQCFIDSLKLSREVEYEIHNFLSNRLVKKPFAAAMNSKGLSVLSKVQWPGDHIYDVLNYETVSAL